MQAFIKIYDLLHKINENDCRKTRNFLVIVCRNTSINIYNKRKRNPEEEYDEKIVFLNNESVENLIINNESFEELNEIIKELKPIYQDVIFLRYSQGFSIDEISQILKVKPKTIQKRIERGKKQLLVLLNKEGELDG